MIWQFFRGELTFREKGHFGDPNIGDRNCLLLRVNDLLNRQWLNQGGGASVQSNGKDGLSQFK